MGYYYNKKFKTIFIMIKKLLIYGLLLNFSLPAIYSLGLLSSSGNDSLSSLFLKYLKDGSFGEELEDKEGEKETKPFEKEMDKDFLLSFSSIDFTLSGFQKVLKYTSLEEAKTNTFFEITTPPPRES